MTTRFFSTAIAAAFLTSNMLFSSLQAVYAEEVGTGFVTIEQKRTMFQDIERLGSWGLAMPSGVINGESKEITLKSKPIGNYALTVKPPAGAFPTIEVYENDVMTGTFDARTALGKLTASGNTLRFSILYNFKFLGQVSVNSKPNGIGFTLKGPDGTVEQGKTPTEFGNRVAGVYSVTYVLPKACKPVLPMSRKLEANGRLAFSSTFSCDALNGVTPPPIEEEPKEPYPIRVSLSAGGNEVPAGGTARYTIVVLNRENRTLENMSVELRYPSDMITIQGANDAEKSQNLLKYTIASLPSGAKWETAFAGKVSASIANGATIAATATVSGDDIKDARISGRSASVQLRVIKELPQTGGTITNSIILMIACATFALTSIIIFAFAGGVRIAVLKERE